MTNAAPSPVDRMRARLSNSPAALSAYDAFAGLVEEKLVTWPKLSADRAGGFIMSIWAAESVRTGRVRIPKSDLNWIVRAGKVCRWKLKGAETVWAREVANHLLRITAKREAAEAAGADAQIAAPD